MTQYELLTTPEAARELGVSDKYLRNLIASGKAFPVKQIGGTWMFDRAEIERLKQRRTYKKRQ